MGALSTVPGKDQQRDVEKVFGKGASFKLPHEDQWEYACRGGRGNQQAFFFGNVLNGTQANCKGNFPYGTAIKDQYLGQTCAVDFTNGGKYTEHPWGLFHMCGNVWQWCDNSHAQSNKKVTRGGAWDSIAWHCRSACRDGRAPDFQCNYIGFRVSVSMDNDSPRGNEQDWVPLFNKKDLTGWELSGSSTVEWKNIDGIVSGVNHSSKDGTGGSLNTSRNNYFDFHFHCDVYLDRLPSPKERLNLPHIVFRSKQDVPVGAFWGFCVYLANDTNTVPTKDVGSLYTRHRGAGLRKLAPTNPMAPIPQKQQWFQVDIIAKRKNILIMIDGIETVNHNLVTNLDDGGAISLNCTPGSSVLYRDVWIKELSAK